MVHRDVEAQARLQCKARKKVLKTKKILKMQQDMCCDYLTGHKVGMDRDVLDV
jgi:hypothetical protein